MSQVISSPLLMGMLTFVPFNEKSVWIFSHVLIFHQIIEWLRSGACFTSTIIYFIYPSQYSFYTFWSKEKNQVHLEEFC